VLWTVATGGVVAGSAAVANGVVYFTSFDDKVYAANSRTGGLLWTYATVAGIDSTPSVVNGTVFAADGGGNVYALDAASGTLKWTALADGGVLLSSFSIANGVGYVASVTGQIFGFDIKTGERSWSADTQGVINATPAVVNGMVYVGSRDNSLYAYALDGGNNAAYKPRQPPSYASLHPDRRLKAIN
jgi:outer membrane protein assembly factor BamB